MLLRTLGKLTDASKASKAREDFSHFFADVCNPPSLQTEKILGKLSIGVGKETDIPISNQMNKPLRKPLASVTDT